MGQILKTKFLCKNGSGNALKATLGSIKWTNRFIKGKWYDGEYETWSLQLFKLNGGWRRYWVINEKSEKEEISRNEMKVIFEFDIQQLRKEKIKELGI
jgi:hypothetical protein